MIFISHSFEDAAEFDNVCNALETAGISFWEPDSTKVGSSLSEELREAIASCDICVFIATRKSINSGWCLAELGAFWGSGKPVLVYLADRELKEEDIPPQFKGNIWDRKIRKIIDTVRHEMDRLYSEESRSSDNVHEPDLVSNMRVSELRELLFSTIRANQLELSISPVMDRIAVLITEVLEEGPDNAKISRRQEIQSKLGELIDAPSSGFTESAKSLWRYRFDIQRDGFKWKCFALQMESSLDHHSKSSKRYLKCLIIRFEKGRVVVAEILPVVTKVWRADGEEEEHLSTPFVSVRAVEC